MSLKELSLAIGRNHSYLHQYIYRNSPKTLPEAEREAVAHLLRIPAEQLRDLDRSMPGLPSEPGALLPPPAERRLPLVTQDAEADPPRSIRLMEVIGDEPSPQAYVLRLARPMGILQPRSLLLLDPATPVRVGDFAALLDNGACQGIGIVALHAAGRPAIHLADNTIMEGPPTGTLHRIEAIRPAA